MIETTPNSDKNIKPIEDWLFLPIARADFEEEQNIDEHLNTFNYAKRIRTCTFQTCLNYKSNTNQNMQKKNIHAIAVKASKNQFWT